MSNRIQPTMATLTQSAPRRVDPGERVEIVAPYSEVCMHLRLSGERVEAEMFGLDSGPLVQLYRDGRTFSTPILPAEAGFFLDAEGFYYYPPEEANPCDR